MEAFASAEDIFGEDMSGGFDFKGFGSTESPKVIPAAREHSKRSPQQLIDEVVELASRSYVSEKLSAAAAVAEKVADVAAKFARTIGGIIGQAIKMAVFKFALEFCAMAIKTLVETVSSMGLKPSAIDTNGVFYNIGTSASVPPPQAAPMSPPRGVYDSPFGNTSFSMGSNGW